MKKMVIVAILFVGGFAKIGAQQLDTAQALQGWHILADAGHWGFDSGAVARVSADGMWKCYVESYYTREITLYLAQYLREWGATVTVSPRSLAGLKPDTSLADTPCPPKAKRLSKTARAAYKARHARDLWARVYLAGAVHDSAVAVGDKDLHVSTHLNAPGWGDSADVRGASTLVGNNAASVVAAMYIVDAFNKEAFGKIYNFVPATQIIKNGDASGIGIEEVLILKDVNPICSRVMVEPGYVTHPEDRANIGTDRGRRRLARITALGILAYALGQPITTCAKYHHP